MSSVFATWSLVSEPGPTGLSFGRFNETGVGESRQTRKTEASAGLPIIRCHDPGRGWRVSYDVELNDQLEILLLPVWRRVAAWCTAVAQSATLLTGTGSRTSSNYGTLGVASTSNVPGSRSNSVSWTGSTGNFWLFGGSGNDSTGTGGLLSWPYPICAVGIFSCCATGPALSLACMCLRPLRQAMRR